MSTVATTEQRKPSVALVTEAKAAEIMALEEVLVTSRKALISASPLVKAFTLAAALKAIEDAITPAMMSDIINLANNPVGFKTDKRPGKKDKQGNLIKPYSETTIKRCVIVALLAGAQLSGNEFNIIVGQAYFTKEFFKRVVNEFPGISRVEVEVGAAAKHGDKSAVMPARASWWIGGERMEMFFHKSDDGDMRIVVTSHATDSPDLLRGKGESKVYRRVFARLSGLNLMEADATTAGGRVSQPETQAIEHDSPEGVSPSDAEVVSEDDAAHVKAAAAFFEAAKEEILSKTGINDTKAAFQARGRELQSTPWSDAIVDDVTDRLESLADNHIKSIRESRKS